jgi:hypothetical protein
MKDWNQWFYTSQVWVDCRAAYKKSKKGLCERCLKEGIITPGKIVHHKIHLTPENIHDPNYTLNWDNLELLCHRHHDEEHEADRVKRRKRRYEVNEYGQVTSVS